MAKQVGVYSRARIEGWGFFVKLPKTWKRGIMSSIRLWTNAVTALALLSSASLCAQEAAGPAQPAAPAASQAPAPKAQRAAPTAAARSALGQAQADTASLA